MLYCNINCDIVFVACDTWKQFRVYHMKNTLFVLCMPNVCIPFCAAVNIPLVTLVLEGGEDALQVAIAALKQGTPVVVIQGSGRAADFIARGIHEISALQE